MKRVTITTAKNYTKGNVPYEINIFNYSEINKLSGVEDWKETKPMIIDFDKIKSKQGFICKYIK